MGTSLRDQSASSWEGAETPELSAIRYDDTVGWVKIGQVFPMGSDRWDTGQADVVRSQPRKDFKPEDLAELKQSIADEGQLIPIVVRQMPSRHESNEVEFGIINGERRWRVMTELGEEEILVRVVAASNRHAYRLSVITDLHNIAHSTYERAQSFIEIKQDMEAELYDYLSKNLRVALEQPMPKGAKEHLKKIWNQTPLWIRRLIEDNAELKQPRRLKVRNSDVASVVGVSERQLNEYQRLAGLEPEFGKEVDEGDVSMAQVIALSGLPDKASRKKLLNKIKEENLSGDAAAAVAAEWVAKKNVKPKFVQPTTPVRATRVVDTMRPAVEKFSESVTMLTSRKLDDVDAIEARKLLRELRKQLIIAENALGVAGK